MSRLRSIALGIWDFIVGDDPVTAFGVAIALGITAIVAAGGVAAWWIVPIAVAVLLTLSLRRAGR